MCLTFFKKFARNNTACPCVLAQFFENVKHYLLNYGRIFTFKFQRLPSRFLRVRLVRCFYVVLLFGLSPLPLLAEWGTNDSNKLNAILVELETLESRIDWTDVTKTYTNTLSIKNNVDSIDDNLSTAKNNLAYILHNLGYGVASSQTGTISQDFSDVKLKLDAIVTALQNLEGGGSGGSGSTDITKDWVKETTFQDYSDNFQTYYDWMRSSLGFEGGSSGSLKDLISPWYSMIGANGYQNAVELWYYAKSSRPSLGLNSPFPVKNGNGNDGVWYDTSAPLVYYMEDYFSDPFQFLGTVISNLSILERQYYQGLAKKQAWNDWYAHTNLVATIVTQADRFFTPPSENVSPTPSFDASTGQIVTPSTGTGSSSESFSIQPSFTNDFAVVNQDVNSVTNNFAFVKQKDIEQRYLVDGILESGSFRDYGTVASGFGDVLNLGGMVIDLRSQFENYRKIITIDTINTVRSAFGYIWTFLAIVASFFTVIKISGVSTSSEGE